MKKEKLLTYSTQLFADIIMAEQCLNCQLEIAKRMANDERIIHKEFFYLARQSFLYTGTMILCKIYEDDCRNKPFSIFQLIRWINNAISLNKEQKSKFDNLIFELDELSFIIDKLKKQRDSFYAHNDKILVDNAKTIEMMNLNHKEKMKLIQFARRFLTFVINMCNGKEGISYTNVDLSVMRLGCVLDDLNRFYTLMEQEIKKYE